MNPNALREAVVTGTQPTTGLHFGVGIVYDDYDGTASTFVDSARVAPIEPPFAQGARELSVLETVRVPLACFEGTPGDTLTTVTFRIDGDQFGAIDHVVLQAR